MSINTNRSCGFIFWEKMFYFGNLPREDVLLKESSVRRFWDEKLLRQKMLAGGVFHS